MGREQPAHRWITFLSDYGLDDSFVGVCKGVIARLAPDVSVLDICHQIAPQDVAQGATVFANAMPYLPVGVHVGLVDPMRRAPTRGVALSTANGSLLVGPDNGVLSLAYDALGGVVAAHEVTNDALWLDTPSRTFRGRDVFAPLAAHLANGVALEQAGPPVDPAGLVRIVTRDAVVDDDHVHAEVRNVDHFGNLSLNVARSDLEAAGIALGDTVELRCGGRTMSIPFRLTYGEVPGGRLVLCEDSFRAIMLAVNLGSAGRRLRAGRGEAVVISRLPAVAAKRSAAG